MSNGIAIITLPDSNASTLTLEYPNSNNTWTILFYVGTSAGVPPDGCWGGRYLNDPANVPQFPLMNNTVVFKFSDSGGTGGVYDASTMSGWSLPTHSVGGPFPPPTQVPDTSFTTHVFSGPFDASSMGAGNAYAVSFSLNGDFTGTAVSVPVPTVESSSSSSASSESSGSSSSSDNTIPGLVHQPNYDLNNLLSYAYSFPDSQDAIAIDSRTIVSTLTTNELPGSGGNPHVSFVGRNCDISSLDCAFEFRVDSIVGPVGVPFELFGVSNSAFGLMDLGASQYDQNRICVSKVDDNTFSLSHTGLTLEFGTTYQLEVSRGEYSWSYQVFDEFGTQLAYTGGFQRDDTFYSWVYFGRSTSWSVESVSVDYEISNVWFVDNTMCLDAIAQEVVSGLRPLMLSARDNVCDEPNLVGWDTVADPVNNLIITSNSFSTTNTFPHSWYSQSIFPNLISNKINWGVNFVLSTTGVHTEGLWFVLANQSLAPTRVLGQDQFGNTIQVLSNYTDGYVERGYGPAFDCFAINLNVSRVQTWGISRNQFSGSDTPWFGRSDDQSEPVIYDANSFLGVHASANNLSNPQNATGSLYFQVQHRIGELVNTASLDGFNKWSPESYDYSGNVYCQRDFQVPLIKVNIYSDPGMSSLVATQSVGVFDPNSSWNTIGFSCVPQSSAAYTISGVSVCYPDLLGGGLAQAAAPAQFSYVMSLRAKVETYGLDYVQKLLPHRDVRAILRDHVEDFDVGETK